ncbi:MAG: hypothetical protein ACLFR8_00470 [Alkalispirochaeta sp.]
MKKRTLIALIVLVVIGGAVAAQTTDSASLFLSGIVGDYVEISVAPTAAATNLLLNIAQASPVEVATVTETSNSAYTVTATSVNGFELSDGTNAHPYTMYYAGTAITASGDEVSSGASANNVNRSVGVTYNSAGTLPAGTYTDTVTFEINAN